MNETRTNRKRFCSMKTKRGTPCRGWAMRGSEPPICAVHAKISMSTGAPQGNSNALKHGYYAKAVRARCAGDIVQKMQSRSLLGELVAGRLVLEDLMAYFLRQDLSPEQKLATVPLITAMIRALTYVNGRIEDENVDWNEILDNLKEQWGGEI